MFSPYLTIALARAKANDPHRAADAKRRTQHRGRPGRSDASDRSVTLRFGSPADNGALARLAAVDSAEPPPEPVLLAEVDGQLVAALALSDGTSIANPFSPTADLIELLRTRATQLGGESHMIPSGRLRSWPRRRAPAAIRPSA